MRKNLLFALLATLLLAPWPVAYAYENNPAVAAPMQVEVAAAPDTAAPRCDVYGKAVGSVTPGDLFFIDAADDRADTTLTLYITNTDELSRYYRYMTLRVGVYVQTADNRWQRLTGEDGLPETFLTLKNGGVSFDIQGCARYKVGIDGGCFYCLSTGKEAASLSPNFYLTVE